MAFLGSILLYPVKNFRYIDILFTASGAATQAGLNTINFNDLTLYQQIVVYIFTTLTTPIFIHGSLLFVRLYWFERHFDNIKESSKLNFKMRRNATLAARTKSFDSTRINTVNNQGLGLRQLPAKYQEQPDNSSTSLKDDEGVNFLNKSPQSSSTIPGTSTGNEVVHISEPSDDDDVTGPSQRPNDLQFLTPTGHISPADLSAHNLAPASHTDPSARRDDSIKFGALPHPVIKPRNEIEPSDMYRSIAMLQNKHHNANGAENHSPHSLTRPTSPAEGEDDGDVLIIKSPNEIEKDRHNPIFTKKRLPPQIQFNVTEKKPFKKWMSSHNSPTRHRKRRHSKKWSKLRKSFSNSTPVPRRLSQVLLNNDFADEDASIDSEDDLVHVDHGEDGDDEDDGGEEDHALSDNEYAISDSNEHHDSIKVNTSDPTCEDEEPGIQRAQSNLVLPSTDATGGVKFGKRSNTLEITPGSRSFLSKSPTFEKFMKKPPGLGRIKRIKTPAVFHKRNSHHSGDYENSGGTTGVASEFDDDDDDDDSDDEEYFSEDSPLRRTMSTNYLSWVPTVGRNSTFVYLSETQKEELGGVEYRAVKLLIKILLFYYIGFHIIAFLFFVPWIQNQPNYKEIIRSNGVSPTWWAFFTAQSSFNDLGFTLTANSMQSFNTSIYVMILMSFFIVIGNTGFPVFLRFLIWVFFKVARPLSLLKESLGFLLDHPRRCFTLLFPSVPSWWLFIILVVLNAVDLVLFIILDLGNKYLKEIPVGYRIVDGLFQAFSTRTAGFAVVDLSKLHPAVQVSYMLMMYISVLPLAISIRRTNVYEEQSLGLYLKEENPETEDLEKSSKTFIGTHLRNQLSFDLWFIFLGLFIICIAEGGKLNKEDPNFSVFTVLFEIISAYGTVGLSLGYPGTDQSFSGKFSVISKIVIVAMMIRGRHRGLPYSLDRAIMIPDADMQRRDKIQENHAIRRNNTLERQMTNSTEPETGLRRMISRQASNFPIMDRMRSRRRPSTWSSRLHVPHRPQQPPEQHELSDLHSPESNVAPANSTADNNTGKIHFAN